jgi:hypothetical protein
MMQNPFENQAFSLTELTAAINKLPNNYGRVGQLGLFRGKGITVRTMLVEEQNGVLTLIPSQPVGSPGQQNKRGGRKVRSFVIPHIPLEDAVMPEDVAGVRAFGSESQVEALATFVNDRLQEMKNKHDITHEFMRMSALKGIVVDGANTTLYNLYTEFGVTQKVVDFALGTSTTNVGAKVREVLRHIEDNLMGEISNGALALVSPEFYDKLIVHPNVEKAYAGWSAAQERMGGDLRKGFTFGGMTFEEYRGQATDAAGSTQRFIAASEGHVIPTGTASSFAEIYAPADFNETVNTIGRPYYSKIEARKFGRGWDLHTQSNPLPICYRPAVLVKIHTSN